MVQETQIDYWREMGAGFRASLLLRLGSLILAAGALANLGTRLLSEPDNPSTGLTIVAWVLFIVGLWLVGSGFIWLGAGPFMTRFGLVVGALHALAGVQFLILLFTSTPVGIPPSSLTVARMVTLIVFVWLERESLPQRAGALLASLAGLQLIKVLLRVMGVLPEWGAPAGPLLDALLLLALAATILNLSTHIKREEDVWAHQMYNTSHSDFGDFNNPEHHWNKGSHKPKTSVSRQDS